MGIVVHVEQAGTWTLLIAWAATMTNKAAIMKLTAILCSTPMIRRVARL
jgi:hypothetical protein